MAQENVVLKFLNKMTDLFVLNLLFLICSLPIVTIGASLTAMYAVNLRSVRYGDGYIVKTFFANFKKSFKQATIAWLVCLVLAVVLYIDYRFWSQVDMGIIGTWMKIFSLVLVVILLMMMTWLFPLIAKMDDSLKQQVKNAAAMAVGHFVPHTVICLGMGIAFLYLAYVNMAAFFVMLLIGFSTLTYMQSFFFYKVFSKYITEAPASEHDLLYGNEGDAPDEESRDKSDDRDEAEEEAKAEIG